MVRLESVGSQFLGLEDGLKPSTDIYSAQLVANTASSLTIPTGAEIAIISFVGGDVWVNYDVAATIPTSSTFTKTGGEPGPVIRYVGELTYMSFISNKNAYVHVCFYSK